MAYIGSIAMAVCSAAWRTPGRSAAAIPASSTTAGGISNHTAWVVNDRRGRSSGTVSRISPVEIDFRWYPSTSVTTSTVPWATVIGPTLRDASVDSTRRSLSTLGWV